MPDETIYTTVNRRMVNEEGYKVEVCDVIYTIRGEKRPHFVDELRGCDVVRASAWIDQQNAWAGNSSSPDQGW